MKLSPLIQQFWQFLPQFTNFFSESVSVSALSAAGGTATATAISHGLSTGQAVNIVGAVQIVDVVTATYDAPSGVLSIETAANHGQIESFDFRTSQAAVTEPVTVQIEGFDQSDFNGTFDLLSVPNRTNFTCQVEKDLGTTPTGGGKVLNYAFNAFIGIKAVTVLDVDTFTYPITPTNTIATTGTIEAHFQFRIQASINSERALESYTKQATDKYVLFLTYGEQTVSKERLILNDANTTIRSGTRRRQRMLDSFNVLVIAPASTELAAVATRDNMDDIELAIFKTSLYLTPTPRFNAAEGFLFNFDSARDLLYNGAYLARIWTFQAQYDITDLDGFTSQERVPMLNINGSINTDLTLSIDLDEDPE